MVNYDSERGISVTTSPGRKTHSKLSITRADVADSGNYTCAPAGAVNATITVFVSGSTDDRLISRLISNFACRIRGQTLDDERGGVHDGQRVLLDGFSAGYGVEGLIISHFFSPPSGPFDEKLLRFLQKECVFREEEKRRALRKCARKLRGRKKSLK